MHQTVANTILIINISNSNKPQQVLSWHLHTPGSHQSSLLNGSESVSESVSEWVSDKGKQWSDSGPIKMWQWKHCFTCVHIYSVPQVPDVGDQPSEKLPSNSATMEDHAKHESDSLMLEIDLSHQNVINSVSVSQKKKKTFCQSSAEVAMMLVFI